VEEFGKSIIRVDPRPRGPTALAALRGEPDGLEEDREDIPHEVVVRRESLL
jgi:hypothetical protein